MQKGQPFFFCALYRVINVTSDIMSTLAFSFQDGRKKTLK